MAVHPTDRSGLEILPFSECLRRLALVPLGRVGFFADGELVVLPVNHVVDGTDVVFRTARGSKLAAAQDQQVAAFEADQYDERTHCGWSVLATGRAEAVYDETEVQRLNGLELRPWVTAAEHPFWIRIRSSTVSGRQTPARR
jgi:uncharacterized protein